MYFIATLILLVTLFWVALRFRPRLGPPAPVTAVPQDLPLRDLAHWLRDQELSRGNVISGAEACIQFANPAEPAKTRYCFVYIHGFSATWRETAPITEQLAQAFNANVLQARLAGHGTDPETMVTPAEDWLASMLETWHIASQLGERIIFVATSTGAPLTTWLLEQPGVAARTEALLFISPNFKIRNPFGFLLTSPFSPYWAHLVLGRIREWEPINDEQAKYWTWRYSTLAIIEMQKCVDFAQHQSFESIRTPVAMMLMKNDPTIDPVAATRVFQRWGSTSKSLIEITIEPDAEEHVFTGDICAPHRTAWTINAFEQFLRTVPAIADDKAVR